VVGVEAFLLVALAVLELAALDGDRIGLGLSTAAFFLAAGAGLAACAYGLWRGRRWGRGPALLAQLIALGLAWNLRGGDTTAVAVGLAVAAVVVFAGLLHPTSVDVLEDRERR
jgi:uncharacterized membrane protein (DUF2068 family)